MNKWGIKIKKLYIKAEYPSRIELAETIGVVDTTLGSWFVDDMDKNVPIKVLMRLSVALNVSMLEIFPREAKEDESFEPAVELMRAEFKQAPVDKSIILTVDRIMAAMHSTLNELSEIKTTIGEGADDEIV